MENTRNLSNNMSLRSGASEWRKKHFAFLADFFVRQFKYFSWVGKIDDQWYQTLITNPKNDIARGFCSTNLFFTAFCSRVYCGRMRTKAKLIAIKKIELYANCTVSQQRSQQRSQHRPFHIRISKKVRCHCFKRFTFSSIISIFRPIIWNMEEKNMQWAHSLLVIFRQVLPIFLPSLKSQR